MPRRNQAIIDAIVAVTTVASSPIYSLFA